MTRDVDGAGLLISGILKRGWTCGADRMIESEI
jgi:hypothetical protein